ncbi:NUDIX domain-containing protein [Nocardioides sp. JQ2195]|uniref:NUDIX hydrolase n=1 Tax=Nocardioides sp. JQ2195 TaxID=2592334 RepID=UPI00143EC697|nr:NUDIX domain-containing protein [Nocardioides sp. JQ2195]QIX28254.1 NUDIX domain-containing protein [Nocardioides sp. JQ2195]
MDPTRTLPPGFLDQAREFIDGTREPATPRAASTVVLLREGDGRPGGLESYLLRRHVGMKFAAGMSVFPGGGVDPRDADVDQSLWAGPTPEEWAQRMDCTPEQATELVCAAVRETFEESGVLLAGTRDTVVADTTGDDWERDRAALEAHELAFSDFLQARDLVIRTDLLAVLGGWLTPVFEPKRYLTWFFVAALPEGQVTRDVSTESETVAWFPVRDALRLADEGQMMLMPPTYATLCDMYDATSPAAALEHASSLPFEMITPTFDPETNRLESNDRIVELGTRVGEALAQ